MRLESEALLKEFTAYLAGGMGKFGKDEFNKANEWRNYCKSTLENFEGNYETKVINPNDYFNFVDEPPAYKTQREIMEFDLDKVRHSDLIICNFNDKYSLGTMAEIAIAYEKRIPIIGLNENNEELHPWQIEFCTRIFSDINEMLDYVEDFYLT